MCLFFVQNEINLQLDVLHIYFSLKQKG
uniref:Uncharacterized protein n=1 Tax=Rhizophora mucronata TaxID=61149 RepID=A0A2P2N7P4_RHIMU